MMPAVVSPYIRVALIWLAITCVWLLLGAMRQLVWGTGYAGYTLGGHIASAAGASLLVVPLVVAARRWLDGGTLAGLGLPLSRAALRPFLVGMLAFLAPFAVALAIVAGFGWAEVTIAAPLSEIAVFVPFLILLVFLYEALPEELAFRGYVLTNLSLRLPAWGAVAAQAALFALWSAVVWTLATGTFAPDRVGIFFVAGLVLGAVRIATGSVWTGIGFHLAFQTAAQLLLNAEREHFTIVGTDVVQAVALGVVPFALALPIVRVFYRTPAIGSAAAGDTGR